MTDSSQSVLPNLGDWDELNTLLDELLELDPAERAARLEQLEATRPDLHPRLRRLVQTSADRHALDSVLESALRFLSEGAAESSPHRLGPWRVLREIGRGGMARVYLAERREADFVQRAAIKLMRSELSRPSLRERFLQERRILASLQDARVARLLDGGETEDGGIWLAMEYIEGKSIDEYCRDNGLDLDARLALLDEVVGAVEHAHRHLVVHRDIKPSNVLVTAEGQVRLLDFGIAKLISKDPDAASEQTVTRALTPRYASPEQLAGQPATTASDVYQLGLLMFELLTGVWPESRELPRASIALRARLEGEGHPKGEIRRRVRELRGDLDHIIIRATATEARHRYPSCERLRADLGHYRDGWPVVARADERWYRVQQFLRRHSLAAGMVSVALLASIVYSAIALDQARAIRTEAAKTTAVRDFMVELVRQADPGNTLGQDLSLGQVLEQGRLQADRALAGQPEIRGELLHTLGELYRALGEHAQAEELLRRAVEVAVDEGNRAAEFRSRLALAQALGGDSRYAEAEEEAGRALARARSNRERALAESELGYMLLLRGRPEEAQPILRSSLARYPGPEGDKSSPVERARLMTYMAYTDLILGNLEVAERDLIAVRDLYSEHIGPDHPEVQGVRFTLARIREMRGDLAGAEEEMRAVVAVETRVLGPDHREVGISRTRLAHILLAQEHLDEAEREFAESLAILEATTDSPHFFLADNLKGYAELELIRGRTDAARVHVERAVDLLEHLLEWPDWRLADAYRIAARLAIAEGDCATARGLLERAREPMLSRAEPYPARWRAEWQRLESAEVGGCVAAQAR